MVQWQRWLVAGEPSVRRPWRAGAAATGGAPCPTAAHGSGGIRKSRVRARVAHGGGAGEPVGGAGEERCRVKVKAHINFS